MLVEQYPADVRVICQRLPIKSNFVAMAAMKKQLSWQLHRVWNYF